MKLKVSHIIISSLLFVFAGCERAFELYVGIPFQPININSEYEPGLNIFGILKAGPSYDTLNHFFEVQKLLPQSDTAVFFEINEAAINLRYFIDNESPELYLLHNYGGGYYTNNEINPDFGELWSYECEYDSFLVKSQTRIPNEPHLQESSMKTSENTLSFFIQPDSTAFLYEVYYFNESDFIFKRIIPIEDNPTEVILNIKPDEKAGSKLFVFAYDKNYERYISTSNIFYKPNAYRPKYSSVEGGYGCFCSTASIQIEL